MLVLLPEFDDDSPRKVLTTEIRGTAAVEAPFSAQLKKLVQQIERGEETPPTLKVTQYGGGGYQLLLVRLSPEEQAQNLLLYQAYRMAAASTVPVEEVQLNAAEYRQNSRDLNQLFAAAEEALAAHAEDDDGWEDPPYEDPPEDEEEPF